MNVYEGMFILDSTKYARDPETVTGQLNELVAEFGGTVLVSQLWDERKLAYPIKGQKKRGLLVDLFPDGRRKPCRFRAAVRTQRKPAPPAHP